MTIAISTAFQKTSKGIRLLSEQPALDIAKREGTWYNSLTSKMKRNGGVDAPRSVTTVCEGDYCMSKHNTTPIYKQCSKCGNTYPATSEYFYHHRNNKDGLKYSCKSCCHEALKKYRKTEKSKEWHRIYHAKPERREVQRVRYYAQHERMMARTAVSNAVKAGGLLHVNSQKCVVCGEVAQHYHHLDYANKLAVIPVCRRCHHNIHARERNENR